MQVVDVNGNMFGYDFLEVIGVNGKPKTLPFGITIGTTTIASGVVGRVLFQGAGNVVQESANLFWDNTTNILNLGSLGFNGEIALNRASTGTAVGGIKTEASGAGVHVGGGGYLDSIIMTNGSGIRFNTWSGSGSTSIERMRMFSTTGNIAINSTTDAGFKLDVNGTARVQGIFTVTNGSTSSIQLNAASARITMGTTGSYFNRLETYSGGVFGFVNDNTSTEVFRISNKSIWTSEINTGFNLVDSLTLTSKLYGITTTTPAIQMNVFTNSGSGTTVKRIQLFNGDNGRIVLNETGGNVLIGTTTDAGFKLDVNGTARVSGGVTSGIIGTAGILNLNRSSDGANVGFVRAESSGAGIQIGSGVNMFFSNNGRIVVNSTTTDASAIFKIDSTTQGFLPPRMTTTQKNAIASPATGLILYDTTLNVPQFYNGTIWVSL